jgi:uncharacterized Ntn-hydrolase superfamily protein
MTFSLVGRCTQTGMFGMVIASSSPAVAARCAHVRAGVGAVASQNVTDPALGPLVLDQLAAGRGAEGALADVMTGRAHAEYRQLLVADSAGRTAVHVGARLLGTGGVAAGSDCVAGGNLLAHAGVPAAMVAGFAKPGVLGDRLIAALVAGLAAGGEAGPVRSAGLKIADRLSWPWVDLRVDWSDDPVGELSRIWAVYAPQAAAYAQRAEDPSAAPSYNVPGDP